MKILITGGAGFVGNSLALHLKKNHPTWKITAFDNLRRAGSEINVNSLAKGGITFLHGDIRIATDLPKNTFDTIIDCAAEPSVMAGYNSSREYPLQTNLQGTLNCLEMALTRKSHFILLSTSRVYSVPDLCAIRRTESETRFLITPKQSLPGCSQNGISEGFPTTGCRSLYGTAKLSSEMFLEEYHHAFGLPITSTRLGVIAGPGQLAEPNQGILTFWLKSHIEKNPLKYIGFNGKQTRDCLDVRDLTRLIEMQASNPNLWNGRVFNAGGGLKNSFSLLEATRLCQEVTGNSLRIENVTAQRIMDIPLYISDHREISKFSGWVPRIPLQETIKDTFQTLTKR
jgi:CDP-paratose 2-epimerase